MNLLRALFVHNDWARDKLLALASPLGDEQLDRPFDMGPGSLRRTLHHLWAAERVWLDRWLERPRAPLPEMEPGLSMSALADRFRATAQERDAFLDGVGPDGFSRPITFTNAKGATYTLPLGDMALHVTNHGHHHRAQALNMLRRSGVKVPGLDYLYMKVEPSPPPPPRFDADTLREYYRYGDWATGRLYDIADGLSDEQLDRPFEIGPGSLRRTLLHIRDAEQWWYENWTDGPRKEFPKLPDATTIPELTRLFQQVARQRNAFLDGLRDADLQRTVSAHPRPDQKFSFALGDTMLQLCGHGTHHRAQALNMLRHLGAETPGLDYITWFREFA